MAIKRFWTWLSALPRIIGKSWTEHRLLFLLLAFLFLILLLSRLWALDAKPFHHDESLHAIESWRYATRGLYKFNPMLHGPFLYHLVAGTFLLLPINDFTARLPIALLGVLLPLLGWPFLRRYGKSASFLWLGLISLSPVLCYYSRTLIMDVLMVGLVLGAFSCFAEFRRTQKRIYIHIFGALLGLMICTKLNWLLYAFSALSFFPVWWVWMHRSSEGLSWWPQTKIFLRTRKLHLLEAGVIMLALIVLLYSTLGTHFQGLWDLFVKMVPYWMEQHRIQRIKGPFDYYIPLLATYELPIFLAFLFCGIRAWVFARFSKDWKFFSLVALLSLGLLCHWQWPILSPFLALLHLSHVSHVFLALTSVLIWFSLLHFHFNRGEIVESFCAHFAITTFFLYSYAGEKVPWLTTHILLSWILYLCVALPSVFQKIKWTQWKRATFSFLVLVLSVWQGFNLYRASFPFAADPRERLVYTHTSVELLELVQRVIHLSEKTKRGGERTVQVLGDSGWPLFWYFRNFRSWYQVELKPDRNPPVVICNWDKREEILKKLPSGYQSERFKLRVWWVPNVRRASVKGMIRYYFFRDVFNPVGSLDVAALLRKDLMPLWGQFTRGESRIKTPRSSVR